MNLEDLSAYDESLYDKLKNQPTEYLPIFEEAATEVVDELTAPRPLDEKRIQDIQILLNSDALGVPMRGMKVN